MTTSPNRHLNANPIQGLRRLAKKTIQLTPERKSEDELVKLFKKRLQPIPGTLGPTPLSIFLGSQVLWSALLYNGFPSALFPVVFTPLFHLIYFFCI